MRKNIAYIILGLLVIIFLVVVIISWRSNSLHKSKIETREIILELTPIGTDIDDVIRIIEGNKKFEWDGYVNRTHGFVVDTSKNTIGEQSLTATIQSRTLFYKKDIVVFWGFDSNSKLIDVLVRKDIAGF